MQLTITLTMDVSEFTASRINQLKRNSRCRSIHVADPLIRGWFLSALSQPETYSQVEPGRTNVRVLPHP